MKYLRPTLALLFAVICSSCNIAHVGHSRHHALNHDLKGKTYDFMFTDDQKDNLQFKTYRSLAESKISKSGLTPSKNNPDYHVFMVYGLSNQQSGVRYEQRFGMTDSGGTSYYNSYSQYGAHSGSIYTPPSWGVTGHTPVGYTRYDHQLLFVVKDRKWKTVYEGNAQSSSENPNNDEIIPVLINKLLADFPGQSGSSDGNTVPLSVRWY